MRLGMKIAAGVGVLVVAVGVAGVAILSNMDFNQYKGLVAEQAKAATGRDLTIAGDLSLKISFNPAIAVDGVSFSNAPWGSRKDMVTVRHFEAQVALLPLLSGNVQVDRVILEGVELIAETDKTGKGNWEFEAINKAEEKPAEKSGGGGTLPSVSEIRLDDINVVYKDGKTGEETALTLNSLQINTDGASSPMKIVMEAALNGAPIGVSGTVGSMMALSGEGAFPVDLKVSAFGAEVTAAGEIADLQSSKGLNIKIGASVPDIPATLAAAAKAVPQIPADAGVPSGPFSLSATVTDPAGGYALSGIALKIGGSDLGGAASVALGKITKIKADLTSDRLALADLLPPSSGDGAAKPAGEKSKKVFPADPLPLDGLKAVEAAITIKGKVVEVQPNLALDNLDIGVNLAGGKLTVKPLGAEIAGGSFNGSVVLDGSSGKSAALDININAADVNAGTLVEKLTGKPALKDGPVTATIGLKGQGPSVAAIMAGLNGKILVQVGKGTIDNAYIDLAGADLFSQGLAALSGEKKTTELECAVLAVNVKNGQAEMDKGIAVETTQMLVQGTGEIDLGSEELDIAVHPTMRQNVGVSAGGLAQLVKLTGTLAEPSVGLDAMGAAKTAASVGAAVATGGLSLLAGSLLDKATQDDHPCATALGKPAPKQASGSTSGGTTSAPPADQKQEGGVGGFLKGIGSALGGN